MRRFHPTDDLVSWGRVLRGSCRVARPHYRDELPALVEGAHEGGMLAVGLSRSYGDSGLNPGGDVIAMDRLDRVLSFDTETGIIRADAGLSLGELIRIGIPHGWFPPVLPGTRFVTLGGAVANDVHGKNHHRAGTFGTHVRELRLRRTDGTVRNLASGDPTGLFSATIGGLGLTGLIEQVELQLKRAGTTLVAEDIPFERLGDFFQLASESAATHEYTVAWIDCTDRNGRGIFSRANHAAHSKKQLDGPSRLSFPIEAPSFALNRYSLRAFNSAYFHLKRMRAKQSNIGYGPFFFPLDAILNWNRLYGRRGMYQYQCVVPPNDAPDAIAAMLTEIAKSGAGSFLAVLKTFGDIPSPGLMSFPAPGATLALDFANRGAETHALMDRLDAVVAEAGGRLYPAKDGRLGAKLFAAGYPDLARFETHIDPGMTSAFWKRIRS